MQKHNVIEEIVKHLQEELEGALAPRTQEIQSLLTMYRFLPKSPLTNDDVVCPAALVELELESATTRSFCFIVPKGGGLVTRVDGNPVQVITPQSPLGASLLGKKVQDTVEVKMTSGSRRYKVLSIR